MRHATPIHNEPLDALGRDYAPLRARPDKVALRDFRAFVRKQYPDAVWALKSAKRKMREAFIFAAFFTLLCLPVCVAAVMRAGVEVLGLVVMATLLAGALSARAWFRLSALRRLGTIAAWYKMYWFAQKNGFSFTPYVRDPYYPGIAFNIGVDRFTSNHIRSVSGQRFFDIGNVSYSEYSGRDQNRRTRSWFYMAIQLDRRLPHIVLDSIQNSRRLIAPNRKSLPLSFSRDQRLSLEGDFDRYFTLYCPKGYERDVLGVLTPDLMAHLIDNAAPFDVEIVDDLMFVYGPGRLRMDQEAVARRIFGIIDTVGSRTIRQTSRYADESFGYPALNIVASQGRRLRRSWPMWGTIAAVVGLALSVYQRIF